jgi:hypothetical protein
VDNRTNEDLWIEYEVDGGAHGGGAELVQPGISEHLLRRHAGSIGLVCSADGNGDASDYAMVSLVAD